MGATQDALNHMTGPEEVRRLKDYIQVLETTLRQEVTIAVHATSCVDRDCEICNMARLRYIEAAGRKAECQS